MNDKLKPLSEATPAELNAAYKFCGEVVRKSAGNFHYAFRLLDGDRRRGMHALYAFCRYSDDAVDDESPGSNRREQLETMRRRLDFCYQFQYSDALTLAFSDSLRRFCFDRVDLDELLLGMEMDLEGREYESIDDLLLYCYRAASTVGLLCLKIFDAPGEAARTFAIELGEAMQLTNILRDVREDFARGRVYLPGEVLQKHGLNKSNLFDAGRRAGLSMAIGRLASEAERHFIDSERAMPREYADRLKTARAMGMIYRRILAKITDDPVAVKRVSLSQIEKVGIVARLLTDVPL